MRHAATVGRRSRERQVVRRLSTPVDIARGEALVHQGEFGREVFLIKKGTVAVWVDGDHVGSAGPGEFVGEVAVLAKCDRTASLVASSDVTVRVFSTPEFTGLMSSVQRIRWHVMRSLVQRIREAEVPTRGLETVV